MTLLSTSSTMPLSVSVQEPSVTDLTLWLIACVIEKKVACDDAIPSLSECLD